MSFQGNVHTKGGYWWKAEKAQWNGLLFAEPLPIEYRISVHNYHWKCVVQFMAGMNRIGRIYNTCKSASF